MLLRREDIDDDDNNQDLFDDEDFQSMDICTKMIPVENIKPGSMATTRIFIRTVAITSCILVSDVLLWPKAIVHDYQK